MSEIDYDKLGESVAKHLHTSCPLNLTADDAQHLHDFIDTYKQAKNRVITVVIGVLVLSCLCVFTKGLRAWILAP